MWQSFQSVDVQNDTFELVASKQLAGGRRPWQDLRKIRAYPDLDEK